MLWLFFACGTPEPSEPAEEDPPTEEPTSALWCEDRTWTAEPQGDGSVVVHTEHYTIRLPESVDAVDLARLVEAAFEAYVDLFGAEPAGQPLALSMYDDEVSWRAAIGALGLDPPASAAGYYESTTELASLYRQPNRYYTQVLLLHEQLHQVHGQARSAVVERPEWYLEGMAEWASRHDWDGRCLRVGADPRATHEDLWARALADLADADLARWVAEDAFPDRPTMMSFVHLLERAGAPDWRAYREAIDFGEGSSFDGAPFATAWEDHVRANQEPLTPLWNEWHHRTPTTLRGITGDAMTAAVWKDLPASFAWTAPPQPGGWVGGLLGVQAPWFDVLWVDEAGEISRWVYTEASNEWETVGSVDLDGDVDWTQDAGGVTVEGVRFDLTSSLPQAMGPAAYNATVDFDFP